MIQGILNAHEVIGPVGDQMENYWVLTAERQVEVRGELEVYKDEIHIFGKKPAYKRAYVGGVLKQFRVIEDGEEVTRTYLDPKVVKKAKATEYKNVGALAGDFFRWTIFTAPGKTTFGAQLIRIGNQILRAIMFENANFRQVTRWDTALSMADAKRAGSRISVEGRLRVWNDRLELVADQCDILEAAVNPFAAMSAEWNQDEEDSDSDGPAPEEDGALPDPV